MNHGFVGQLAGPLDCKSSPFGAWGFESLQIHEYKHGGFVLNNWITCLVTIGHMKDVPVERKVLDKNLTTRK